MKINGEIGKQINLYHLMIFKNLNTSEANILEEIVKNPDKMIILREEADRHLLGEHNYYIPEKDIDEYEHLKDYHRKI